MTGFWDLSNGAKVLLAACSIVVLAEGGYLFYIQTHGYFASAGSTCEYVIGQWEAAEPEAAAPKTTDLLLHFSVPFYKLRQKASLLKQQGVILEKKKLK